MGVVEALPPHVVAIYAPPDVIESICSQVTKGEGPTTVERSGPDAAMLYGSATVRLVADSYMGAHMVFRMSDGTIRTHKVGE